MSPYDQQKIEQFLLGGLASVEQEEIEQRIFADDELFVRVEEIETDLIDAYVRDKLSDPLLALFERSLRENPARNEKIAFARLLAQRTAGAETTRNNILPYATRHATPIRLALMAALLILAVGLPLTLRKAEVPDNGATKLGPTGVSVAVEAQDTATVAIKRPPIPTLAVKRPPIPKVTTGIDSVAGSATTSVTFVLSALTLRSGAANNELRIGSDVEIVEMQLGFESDEFPNYNVDIRNSSGTSVWTGVRLPLTTIDDVPALSFEVPAKSFSDGRHELVVAGVSEDGAEEIAYLDFSVRHMD